MGIWGDFVSRGPVLDVQVDAQWGWFRVTQHNEATLGADAHLKARQHWGQHMGLWGAWGHSRDPPDLTHHICAPRRRWSHWCWDWRPTVPVCATSLGWGHMDMVTLWFPQVSYNLPQPCMAPVVSYGLL